MTSYENVISIVSNLISYGGDSLIDTNKLRGVIAERGYSKTDVAKMLGITPKTFYEKMKKGVFRTDEVEIMIDRLNIAEPMQILFVKE